MLSLISERLNFLHGTCPTGAFRKGRWQIQNMYTVSQKKLGHFYFFCNFVKCWPILIILALSKPEIISAVI